MNDPVTLIDTINCPRCGLGIDVHASSRHVAALEARVAELDAEAERLQARERELEAALRDVINTPVTSASALFAALDRAERTLAAVSAETEADDE